MGLRDMTTHVLFHQEEPGRSSEASHPHGSSAAPATEASFEFWILDDFFWGERKSCPNLEK